MNKLLLALLATSSLAFAAPAFAQQANDSYYWRAPTYALDVQYQRVLNDIQRGIDDGSYTDQEARQYYRELQAIEAQAQWQQDRGYYSPSDIEAQLVSLRQSLSVADERGQEQRYYGYYNWY